jgi:biotin carboxyl carrier protein
MIDDMTEIRAEMDANVWQVLVTEGQTVAADDELIILESMKMEIPVVAPHAGVIVTVHVKPEDSVPRNGVLISLRDA